MAETQRDVTLYYNGQDITDSVDIIECALTDVSGGESDCLNLKLDHADEWFRWGPKKNDTLRVTRGGYDSKTLYLHTVAPQEGAYRIYATGGKCAAHPARWQTFENIGFEAIMRLCAGECSMGARAYGVNAPYYRYLLREGRSAPDFLSQLAGREGAVLKALDGDFVAIGIDYAQGLPAMHEMELESDQLDSQYIDRRDLKWESLTIKTPFGEAAARDAGANGQGRTITDLAVEDNAMAYRWARGMLLSHNRLAEILNIEMDFNPGYTAMARINVKSRTDAKGAWIIDRVEQNLLDGRTKARMLRCLTGIG